MATTRRDRNQNFFKWKSVENGSNRFTPNTPVNWFHEIVESAEPFSFEEEVNSFPDFNTKSDPNEEVTERENLKMTPSNGELLKMASVSPPHPEWFERDEEKPF